MINTEYLSDVMKLRKLRQIDISRELGVTKGFVSQIMSGSRVPSLDVLIKLAKILQLDTNILLNLKAYKKQVHCNG